MTVKEAAAEEAISLGRPVKVLDYAWLKGNILVVVLRSRTSVPDVSKHLVEIRMVSYAGNKKLSSAIVATKWLS